MRLFDGFVASEATAQSRSTLSYAIFDRRAKDILELINQLRTELGLQEAINVAIDRFVDAEEHPELRRFSEALALARRQAVIQQRLDDDREALHHGNLNHDSLVSTGHHYEMLRHEACQYNHLLRRV